MEARFKTEKERYGLVLARAQASSNINDDLRREYETQLALFKVRTQERGRDKLKRSKTKGLKKILAYSIFDA